MALLGWEESSGDDNGRVDLKEFSGEKARYELAERQRNWRGLIFWFRR